MDPQEAETLCRNAIDLVVGNGVEKDASKAADIFRSVADSGYPEGMFGLAELLYSGNGVQKDVRSAMRLYENAASAGNIPAAFRLGNILLSEGDFSDPGKGREYIQSCCDAGFEPAYGCMGDVCFYGIGASPDQKTAAVWYGRAASAGDPVSMFKLGCMYESGNGVDVDPGRSSEMFRRSAEAGFPEAQFKMASFTYDGIVDGGKKASFDWYSRCSERIPVAKFNMATMLLSGDGVPPDKEGAFKLYGELADSGDADSMFQIGRMYIEGDGVHQDPEEGFRRIGEAARMGSAEAKQLVENLRRRQNTQMIHIDGAEE